MSQDGARSIRLVSQRSRKYDAAATTSRFDGASEIEEAVAL
jgi:hypothetical protein